MSMPFLIFSCTACDYHGYSTVLWGRFDYKHQGRQVPIRCMLAWCKSCGDLAPVEILPSAKRIRELQRVIDQVAAQVASLTAVAAKNRSFPGKLFGSQPRLPPSVRELDYQRFQAEDELKQERIRLTFVSRKSAKCLLCGSKAWIAFPWDCQPSGTATSPGDPVSTGLNHPGCSGQRLVAHSGYRVSVELTHKLYDWDGHLLETLPEELSDPGPRTPKRRSTDKNALVKELLRLRVRTDPLARSMGFAEQAVDSLSELQLAGTPEATIVTIVETWALLRKAGSQDAEIFSRIENHRSRMFPKGQMPKPLNLTTYIKYRLKLEHSRGAPMQERFINSAIEIAREDYGA